MLSAGPSRATDCLYRLTERRERASPCEMSTRRRQKGSRLIAGASLCYYQTS